MSIYDEAYYNGGRGAYKRYVYKDSWKKRAKGNMDAFPDAKSFMDVGCAKGFILRGYVELGVPIEDVYGYDISEYAIKEAESAIKDQVECCSVFDFKPTRQWDLVSAYDFLEHLPTERMREAVKILEDSSAKYLHIMLMVAKADWDTDESHVSIMPLEEWLKFFSFELIESSRDFPHIEMAKFKRV